MKSQTYTRVALAILFSTTLASMRAQTPAAAPQFQTIYDFPPAGSFSGFPGPPVIGPNGAIFGATIDSGPASFGTVFELTPPSTSGELWTQTVIHTFTGSPNEGTPKSVVLGPSGALYVLTVIGPTNLEGFVYQFAPPTDPGGTWTETVIHHFGLTPEDPAFSDLVLGPQNTLFGLTAGGANGTVSSLVPPPMGMGTWSVRAIYTFTTRVCPSSLTFAPSGTLLITGAGCPAGPENIPSAVFALAPPSSTGDAWTFKTLYTFAEYYQLLGPLTVHKNGIYGCTEEGTLVFQLLPPATPGGSWTETTLYTFPAASGGATGKVVFGKSGVLYGVTHQFGNLNAGTVYGLSPSSTQGTPWNYHLVHALNGGSDGDNPVNGLSVSSKGILYGFTFNGAGTAYMVIPGTTTGADSKPVSLSAER